MKPNCLSFSPRYAFTVLANLSVFTITFFSLNTGDHTHEQITGGDSHENDTYWGTSTLSTIDSYLSTGPLNKETVSVRWSVLLPGRT